MASADSGCLRASLSAVTSRARRPGFSVRASGNFGKSSGNLAGSRMVDTNHVLTPSTAASPTSFKSPILSCGINYPPQEIGNPRHSRFRVAPADLRRRLTPVIEPEHNATIVGKWLINVHPHGNQVGLSIPVHVCRFQADEMSRRVADVMLREVHFAIVLKPDDTLRVRLLPKVVATDGGDIQIAIAVEVDRNGGAGPREKADGMMLELEIALLFEPLDAVPGSWAWGQVVEGIPIGEQDVH